MENNSQQKNQNVYSVGSIVLGSFFGGPVATMWMVYKNSVVFNKRIPAMKLCLLSLLAFLLYFAILFAGSESYSAYQNSDIFSVIYYSDIYQAYSINLGMFEVLVWFSMAIAFYSLVVWLVLDKKSIKDFLEKGFKKRNFFGIMLISFVVMTFFNLCFGLAIQSIKTEHYFGTFYGFSDPGLGVKSEGEYIQY